jgi:hypothetical protein
MRNKKTSAAEKARIATEQAQAAQEKIAEMATTSKYQVDEALQKASRVVMPLGMPMRISHPAKNG